MKTITLLKTISTMVLTLYILQVSAQKNDISGIIRDVETKEPIIGATIYAKEIKRGSATNSEGYFLLILTSKQQVTLDIRCIGYQTREIIITPSSNQRLNISLTPISITTGEVQVEGARAINSLRSTQTSAHSISPIEIEYLPSLGGEKDIIKAIQMLPGVTGGSEGSSDLVVRGGSPDQNLFLIDGVPIYNASHVLGLFSIFTPEAVNNVDFYKGGFSSNYGGRLSSVVDISMKEGNRDHITGDISIGTISSKGILEGPINKGKGAFFISARRTYLDLLLAPFLKYQSDEGNSEMDATSVSDFKLYFYDITGKLTYQIGSNTKAFLSVYNGTDVTGGTIHEDMETEDYTQVYSNDNDIQWGNLTTSLRFNHLFSSRNYANLSFYTSRYNYETNLTSKYTYTDKTKGNIDDNSNTVQYLSKVVDWGIKYDQHHVLNQSSNITWGASAIYHQFTPGKTTQDLINNNEADTFVKGAPEQNTSEINGFLQWELNATDRWKTSVGLRYSLYHTDNKTFQSIEPRLSIRYLANDKLSFKASYDQMQQPIHLLAQNSFTMGTSIWVPATSKLSPGRSQQITIGTSLQLSPQWMLTVEGWGKRLKNQIEFRYGSFDSSENWQDEVTSGKGRAYGLDVLLRKRTGKTTGWISYTLSRNERQYDELNNKKWYPYRYDRTHDLKVVMQHTFSKKVSLGANYLLSSGYPFTIPKSFYRTNLVQSDFMSNDAKIAVVPEVNSNRMRSYHRLDCSISLRKERKRGTRTWSFGVYNIYARKNPFNYTVDYTWDKHRLRIREYSLFSIIPSVTYRFNFK
ncbi:TonB-dependent receptor [Halosquirtibacter xylanolyticus]|uniref:TonB-dependent receptor n=1 Tax=Halosquirtibacter xylanolyticus TaxID=3374599 RepID=UPI00374A6B0A|nr:TonB-dependent receptor [Prolixibacteraceae bacterium]